MGDSGMTRVANWCMSSMEGAPIESGFFFFQAEDGIRDLTVTGVQTCALPIFAPVVPAEPAAPAGPAGPVGPAAPGAPAPPCGPAGPWLPAAPTEPVGPVAPCAPIGRAHARNPVPSKNRMPPSALKKKT